MIALIAHDAQKGLMLDLVRRHFEFFQSHKLVATGNTGQLLADELQLDIERVAHGPLGGDLMIGGRVADGKIEAVLFLRDPLTAQPHEPDVSALMRVCDAHQIPLATNRATAEHVIQSLSNEMKTK